MRLTRVLNLILGVSVLSGCDLSSLQSELAFASSQTSAINESTESSVSTTNSAEPQKPAELKNCSLQSELSLTVVGDLSSDVSEKKLVASETVLSTDCENVNIGDLRSVKIRELIKTDSDIKIYRGPRPENFEILADRSLNGETLEFCHHKNKINISFDSGYIDLDSNAVKITRTITVSDDSTCQNEDSKKQPPPQGERVPKEDFQSVENQGS
ncbi:MAG: hypothetical protein KDD45_14175 [Bdellovibrionales bacterium]|nr:hypothetical protein [Bdellovibrionales bacterium]